jgi:hypothetical protein
MKSTSRFQLMLGDAPKAVRLPPRAERRVARSTPARPTTTAAVVARAVKATSGAAELISQLPALGKPALWQAVASFTVCQKTGTATFLDIWDADHFDGFTDMQRCLAECRAWFSADGFAPWDSPQTKTGRINCYFKAPAAGHYVINAQLQSYGGLAQVECLIDSFNYGPLSFNGAINQPHPANLSAGYHSFRIRQKTGSFFFVGLTVWAMPALKAVP